MPDLAALNWWAIIAATVAAFALGGLWYGPMFGKAWLVALGKEEGDLEPSPRPFVIAAVATLVTCIVVAALMQSLGLSGLLTGALFGLVVGVGLIITATATDSGFCGSSLNLWLIQSGYHVAYCVLMGGIIGVWQ